MGHGVAQIVAQSGYQVLAIEMNKDAIDKGMKRYQFIDMK
jgi:3-hydroxyacyl-CoA dehydrogenase